MAEPFYAGPGGQPDKYTLVARLDVRGGEGHVWRARITSNGQTDRLLARREFAIKQLAPQASSMHAAEALGRRWMASVDVMQDLEEEGLAYVVEGFQGAIPHARGERVAEKTWFLVMEWVPGLTYEDWLALHPGDIRPLAQAALGLDALHAKGYVHGDVKPENLKIIENSPSPATSKLVDFTLLSEITGRPPTVVLLSGAYTDPATSARRAPYTAYSDLYSFAATLYRGLVGREPDGDHAESVRLLEQTGGGYGVEQIAAALDPDPQRRQESTSYVPGHLAAWFVDVVDGTSGVGVEQREAVRTIVMASGEPTVVMPNDLVTRVLRRTFGTVLNDRSFALLLGTAVVLGIAFGAMLANI